MPGYAVLRSHSADTRLALHVCLGVLASRVARCCPVAHRAQAKPARRLGISTTLCPRLLAAMSPPFAASQPHCLGHLQHSPWLPPFGDPPVAVTLVYSTGTARTLSGATLRAKQLIVIAAVFAVIGSGVSYGFALPPTPEPIQMEIARSKPGGFLRGSFQVRGSFRPPQNR